VLRLNAVKKFLVARSWRLGRRKRGILCEFDSLPFSLRHRLRHGSDAPDGLMIGRNPACIAVSAMLEQSQQQYLKRVLQVSMLLAGLVTSPAFATDYARLAQSGQTAHTLPSQPIQWSETAVSCQINCETSAMNCINNCGLISGPDAKANPDFRTQCSLSCSSRQLVCKQGC
jgi:hypothetical protein